ncbi:unnamed protein product [Adineta steineri]|uniref:RNA-dependent RNA polymerase n=1 Tax=Adineta steineri TaxID=433720 RepID=A0A813MX78_9BILA|nr:unnamed protein product [Adineta steineri]CAF1134240.1 unnamed protein product [Adineta steineri]
MASMRLRSDSIESNASMWEKTYERFPQAKQDAPFANNQNNDLADENLLIDDNDNYESDSDTSPPITTTHNDNKQTKPWEYPTKQEKIIIIINNQQNFDKVYKNLKQHFLTQGIKWTDEEEKSCSWHFGLTSIHLHFIEPQFINIQWLCSPISIPFWITFNKEKKQYINKNCTTKQPIRHKFTKDFITSLRYGALTDLNMFYYSPKHSWTNQQDLRNSEDHSWFLSLNEQRNGGEYIEWIIENFEKKDKKQLLVTNINHSIIIDSDQDGFDIYIFQHCNMNEFETFTNHRSHQNESFHSRNSLKHAGRYFSQHQSNSRPRASASLRQTTSEPRQSQRKFYDKYCRIGFHSGCYFSTIQFSLRIDRSRLAQRNAQTIEMRIKQILSSLIEFFIAHNLTVCFGKINSLEGSNPYLFFKPNIPNFPSLIMKYSWQILSTVGYRLQLQIDEEFLQKLFQLSKIKENPDELFYRVCVYLSRIFSLKPFVNIINELEHAVDQSQQKRDASAYGLIRKIDINGKNEAYIPSVTLTPTTIRIKPLKLCRTNRVLRANREFGEPLYHFILVDIRDENGRPLQSFHFRDLREFLLDYLVEGFIIMDDHRQYQYLHHSQSQLRQRQFWFYHHNIDGINLNFAEAYRWMGNFDNERNPAKYAARMALCFSTTKATIDVPSKNVILRAEDIEVNNNGKVLSFTDGCGKMSEKLRNQIKDALRMRNDFSAVQFRYAGTKGVVSLDTTLSNNIDLYIRQSMTKFQSDHQCFEVCKLSAPRPLYLNRQAILLLSYRRIPDTIFLILQQQNHLDLIRALLRNSDAEKLILEKIPSWFLPRDIHIANIDFVREPFFRQLLISACLQSTRDLLQRTRIRIPRDQGRNMMGIVDEYNVLKPNEVFVQYTLMDKDQNNHHMNRNKNQTEILNNRQVVITKNPCYHPGDIRTFTAVEYPQLRHLKDVIVFSQQGDRPAPHDISGSDLDGDEYLVIWHEDLVPNRTNNAQPYDYDPKIPNRDCKELVTRKDINNTILEIAEQDCLGKLSNLHLAFADKFGVDCENQTANDVLSTIELAGAISQEVDSGKTGYHPLKEDAIRKLNLALDSKRPDYMNNANFDRYRSEHILGKLYRSSKKTLPEWNRLVRYHRHLRHLQVRTGDEPEEEEDEQEEVEDNDGKNDINLDSTLLNDVDQDHPAYQNCVQFADKLVSVYRQEIFEILNIYGLSHESDLWCRNSINGITGELEDTAYTELEQLVTRTRARFFFEQTIYCEGYNCHDDTSISMLCGTCRKRQQAIAVACYCTCYGRQHAREEAPILSLPWLFATPLLHGRIKQGVPPTQGLLSIAMQKALQRFFNKGQLTLDDVVLKFKTSKKVFVGEARVDISVCIFIEIVQYYLGQKRYRYWAWVLSRFIQNTPSFIILTQESEATDEWELVLRPHKIDEYDVFAARLMTMPWEEKEDSLMHDYFNDILRICFEEGRQRNDIDFLNISEDIILLLQKLTIEETIL